jgi:hypothetical protein
MHPTTRQSESDTAQSVRKAEHRPSPQEPGTSTSPSAPRESEEVMVAFPPNLTSLLTAIAPSTAATQGRPLPGILACWGGDHQ